MTERKQETSAEAQSDSFKAGDKHAAGTGVLPLEVELERYRIKYGLYKVIFGTAIVGLAGILVPGAIDFWQLVFENQRIDNQLRISQTSQQQEYVKDFLSTALNQDIELRIRFAEYFAHVADERYRNGWQNYFESLTKIRNRTRLEIHEREAELRELLAIETPSVEQQARLDQLERELEWRYREVGYVERDRSVVRSREEEERRETSGSIAPSELPSGDPRIQLASSVGMLVQNERGYCTAWLLANNFLITADYCVRDFELSQVKLRMGYSSKNSAYQDFTVDSNVVEINQNYGYALMRVQGNPTSRFGSLSLSTRTPQNGESLFLLHHSRGGPLRITENCTVTGIPAQGDILELNNVDTFEHNCSNDPGSGGGPIFANTDLAILGIHYAGSPTIDVGIRMDRILYSSETLDTLLEE